MSKWNAHIADWSLSSWKLILIKIKWETEKQEERLEAQYTYELVLVFEIWLIKRFPFVEWLAHVLRFPPLFALDSFKCGSSNKTSLIIFTRGRRGRRLGGAEQANFFYLLLLNTHFICQTQKEIISLKNKNQSQQQISK